MAFGSRPPKRRSRVVPWDCVKLDGQRLWHGWLAGPPIWLECHHVNKRTLPCLSHLTDGAKRCTLNHKEFFPRWRGYVPLWGEDGARSFVVVGDRYEDQLERLYLLAPVAVGKQAMKGQPIKVWLREWSKAKPPVPKQSQTPQDIRPYLLVLWNRPEVSEWFASNPFPPLPELATCAPSPVVESIPDPVSDQRVSRLKDDTNSAFAEAARRMAERNGKH